MNAAPPAIPIRFDSAGLRTRSALALLLANTNVVALAVPAPVVAPLTPPAIALVAPGRVATDAQSRLFITDPLAGRVAVVNALGQPESSKTNLGQPLGIAVDSQGRIYIGDAQAGAVNQFDPNWNLLAQLGQGPGEFLLPGHITTVTDNGVTTIYVSDGPAHTVKAYRDGVRIGQYGSLGIGPNEFNFPAGIWPAPDRTLFVVDQNNDRVQVLDRDGNFLRWFSLESTPGQFSASGRAQGITGDSQGRLYIADTFQGYVKVFDLAGQFLGFVGRYGELPGQLRSPGGVATDAQGRLWIANANNARLEGFCFVQPNLTPATQIAAEGSTVSFSVDPGCGGSFNFQWLKDSGPLTDGGNVTGATQSSLTLTGITAQDGGSYSVQVANSSGSVISSHALLSIILRPVITVPPADQMAAPGGDVILRVTAGGSPLLFFQWSQNGVDLAGATGTDLLLANVTAAANGTYSVLVTNAAGRASASAKFAVTTTPSVTISQTPSGDCVLAWDNPFYVLQTALALEGPWTTLEVASPFTISTATATTPAQYFRLLQQSGSDRQR